MAEMFEVTLTIKGTFENNIYYKSTIRASQVTALELSKKHSEEVLKVVKKNLKRMKEK